MGQSRGENSTLYPVGQFSSKDKFGFLCLLSVSQMLCWAGRRKEGVGGQEEIGGEEGGGEGRRRGEEREWVGSNE